MAQCAPFALAVLVSVAGGAPCQEPGERGAVFPARAELVTVDAVVVGHDGLPIAGLDRGDFALREDGVPQEIVAFEAVEPPAAAATAGVEPASLPNVPGNRTAAGARARAFVVVFDELHLGAAEAVRAREAVRAFLEGLADGDRVTLAATGDGSWWHARMPDGRAALLAVLTRLRGRVAPAEGPSEAMTEYEAMRIHRDRDPLVAGHVIRRWSYYLLGYAPTDARRDGRFRRIEVRVARPGARVRAGRGYYPSSGSTRTAARASVSAVQQALDSPFDLDDVPLRAAALVLGDLPRGEARVLFTTDVATRALEGQDEAGGTVARLDYRIEVVGRDAGTVRRHDEHLALGEPRSGGEADASTWLPITRELPLAPGRYQARVAVRDSASGRMGSLSHDFEVPSLGGLRISTPLLSGRLGQSSGTPMIAARRTFAPADVLHCHFEVYGAARDPVSGRHVVSAGFAIRSVEGRLLAASLATAMTPVADGTLARTVGIPLAAALPGRYEVVVVARDELDGRTAEVREASGVEPGDGG